MKKILFCSFGSFHIVCPESLRGVDATSVGTADCLPFSELSSVDSVVDDVDVVKFFWLCSGFWFTLWYSSYLKKYLHLIYEKCKM